MLLLSAANILEDWSGASKGLFWPSYYIWKAINTGTTFSVLQLAAVHEWFSRRTSMAEFASVRLDRTEIHCCDDPKVQGARE